MRGRVTTTALGACLVVAAVLIGVPLTAQSLFRVTYAVKTRTPPSFVLDGRVVNVSGRNVVDVWVTVEAVSASGKVLASGITFVGSSLAKGDTAAFLAKVPYVEGAEDFKVAVTSYRLGGDFQSP